MGKGEHTPFVVIHEFAYPHFEGLQLRLVLLLLLRLVLVEGRPETERIVKRGGLVVMKNLRTYACRSQKMRV